MYVYMYNQADKYKGERRRELRGKDGGRECDRWREGREGELITDYSHVNMHNMYIHN